ncbi:hypothetical protein ANCCAN_25023 [Ancylostoma caninum]|uniref:Uncharacterized protein n=1 Tax=Ancylostoma caninum TaxID=29170 RepID=A0A368FAP5_ANCCA|nr:hypothetical protein ANCCAN_25023 [Ancylostoma caninum]
MDTYIRIAINGPGNPAPYHFNKFMKRWQEQGHLPADHPGETRGPGAKTVEGKELEKNTNPYSLHPRSTISSTSPTMTTHLF